MYDLTPVPFKYVDSLEPKQHIALFYEESEYARLIEFRFIKHGLEIGEHCVYATEEDSGSIVLKMLNYGIPLRYFQSRRLRVYQIHRTCGGHDEIMKRCKRDVEMITSDLIPPFRIVSRIVPDVSTTDGMSVELELECTVHDRFDDFGGSLICPYDMSKIESSKRKQWMEELRANHHAVIYAPKFGEGGVFCAL
jgi:MEDS: MEthanogen/methylotroph, DcmR Sensory domain